MIIQLQNNALINMIPNLSNRSTPCYMDSIIPICHRRLHPTNIVQVFLWGKVGFALLLPVVHDLIVSNLSTLVRVSLIGR